MARLFVRRRAEPGTGLIYDLIAARDGADRLSEPELVILLSTLIAAGCDPIADALSRFLLTLLGDEGALWRQLVANPGLVPTAVDELLRHSGRDFSALLRIATEDVQLPSGMVRAGQTVAIAGVSSQRDEKAYPDPDKVRFDREAPPLLAFGAGPHHCLGVYLANTLIE